ncbi:MAG: terminase small subunit [Alphaproteobacteria bacterium]
MPRKQVPALLRRKSEDFGPAMLALNDRQRTWVLAYIETGGNATEACRRAGYGDSERGSAKIQGYRNKNNPKIQAAIVEMIDGQAKSDGVRVGFQALLEIAGNPQHKDQAKAAIALVNLAGLGITVQHKHDVKIELTVEEKVQQLKQFAEIIGVAPDKVLGVVDLEPEEYEVEDG